MAIVVEILTNLFQAFMFTGFLYLFFEKPEQKLKKILPFMGCTLSIFGICSFYTLSGKYTGTDSYFLDSVLCVATMLAYSVIFLKGNLYSRIIMPFFAFTVNAIVSYGFSYIVSFVTGISVEEFFTISTYSRYTALVVVNITTLLCYLLILALSPRKIHLSGVFETAAFSLISVLCMIILYCCLFIFQDSDFDEEILVYLLICCLSMLAIAVLVCLLLSRISKANKARTQLLLIKQHEKLYEKNTIAINNQIKKISAIRHDTRNRLSTLERLINEQNYSGALELCKDTTEKLNSTYTPVNTSNPVLNAILNVELEKASAANIEMTVETGHNLEFINQSDTVSLVGNLCDNAIEHLRTLPAESRKMHLQINTHLDFVIITCKNQIADSVLKSNPKLSTTKADKASHGLGVGILRKIAETYEGDILTNEADGFFIVSVIIKNQ